MAGEDARYVKGGLDLVHPANRALYRHLLADMQKAIHAGNRTRSSSIRTISAALRRYPVPIEKAEDAAILAGVGDHMVSTLETVMKECVTRSISREACVDHAEKVLRRLRTFLVNNGFAQDEAVGSSADEWRPLRFSAAWTFIMVLGLFADSSPEGRLSCDDIISKAEELRARLPKCRLGDIIFVRQLIERGIVDFAPSVELINSSKGEVLTAFKTRKRTFYTYKLTEKGRRIAEDLISACELPISFSSSATLFTQTSMSQQLSQEEVSPLGAFSYIDDGSNGSACNLSSDDDVQSVEEAGMTSEAHSPYMGTSKNFHNMDAMRIAPVAGDSISLTHRGENINSLESYGYSPPQQPMLDAEDPSQYQDNHDDAIIIADSSPTGTADWTMSKELNSHRLRENIFTTDSSDINSKGRSETSQRLITTGIIDGRRSPPQSFLHGHHSLTLFDKMVNPISLDHSLEDISQYRDNDEGRHSDGSRTPVTSKSGLVALYGTSMIGSGDKGRDVNSRNKARLPLRSAIQEMTNLRYQQISPNYVTSDKYRKLTESLEDTSQCYSQCNLDTDKRQQLYNCFNDTQMDTDTNDCSYKSSQGNMYIDYLSVPGRGPSYAEYETKVADDIEHASDTKLTKATDSVYINVESTEVDSQGGEMEQAQESEWRLNDYESEYMHLSASPCDRFLPLRERLKQKYGVDLAIDSGKFEIITVVDNREVNDADGRYLRRVTEIFADAEKKVIFRQLPLGDVIWLLRYIPEDNNLDAFANKEMQPEYSEEGTSNSETALTSQPYLMNEKIPIKTMQSLKCCNSSKQKRDDISDCFVLDWVVERKTTTDLMASITDGRYDDQKIRMLRLVGFRHVCYLFEDIEATNAVGRVSAMNKGVNTAAIASARINTQFITGFNVIRTTGMSHTASNILTMHKHIERCTHERWSEASKVSGGMMEAWLERNFMKFHIWDIKNRKQNQLTFLELFGRQLRSIPGCSADTTQAILTLWPSPALLSQELKHSNLAYINEALLPHRKKGKRAPVTNNVSCNSCDSH
ncbi:class II crossover junction endonuclease mus81 like protein [Babesia gibsoni]|uniref:Crossover junction endonuclease MUS81 n=1 Tax=Babesia gibsoni TaxID=33632 RepID=A0AAD8P870_BABGI|nr:class II crossover junction endonuclease mus81 like protein [Babesia gibsoni]